MYYKNEPVENYNYDDQPHEIAARKAEETLYLEYINAWQIIISLLDYESPLVNMTLNWLTISQINII